MSEIKPAEIVVAYANAEIMQLWVMSDDWQRACLGNTNNKYPKRTQLQFTKKLNGFFPACWQKHLGVGLTFYIDANQLGMSGYKAGNVSKVIQSPYASVQKSEWYTILIVLLGFNEYLNIIIDSEYAEGLDCIWKLMNLLLITQN